MARTTLDIDDAVLRELKARRAREGKSLSVLASELLAQALRQTSTAAPDFLWVTSKMGRARTDLEDRDVLQERLDDG